MNSDKESRKAQNNKIELKSAESRYEPGGDALLRHDFGITEGTTNKSSVVNRRSFIEVVRGWEPISHSFRKLVVDYFLRMRVRAFPPLLELYDENTGEDEDTD